MSLIVQPHIRRTAVSLLATGLLGFSASSALAADVDLRYTSEVSEELRDAIADTIPDVDAAQTALQARRQARRAKVIAAETLNAFGYYAPTLSISVEETDGQPVPVLEIETGPLFTVDRVELKFADPAPRADDVAAFKNALPVKSGEPAIPANVIDAERIIGVEMRNLGYAFGQVEGRDVIGDKEAATISVRYRLATGPRVQFGEVVYPDNIRTRASYLSRLNTTDSGEVFDPADLALFNSRLSETRMFDASLARLSAQPVGVSETGDAIHDVILEIDERDRNTLALGGTYGTNEGFGVNAELTRRNATRRGDLLIADARVAERERGLNLIWRRPNELGFGKGLIVTGALLDENTDAFDQQLAKLGAGFEIIRGPRLSYSLGVNGQYIREDRADVRQDFQTLSAYAGVAIDQSDSFLDPRRGWRAEGRVVPTYAFGGSGDQPYLRSVLQGRAYLPLDEKARFVAAGRLRFGTLLGAQADDVPAESRFYAGGGGSVRGYGYQAIGPFDAGDDPLGGRSLLDGSVEARWRYNSKIGVVGFVDAGNVSDAQYPEFDTLRIGAGVGVRYMTPAGPLRLDAAIPLNPSDRDQSFQLYISIGQAF